MSESPPFDFRAPLVSDDGEVDEDRLHRWTGELIDRFAGSPEGQEVLDAGLDPGDVHYLVEYGTTYLGRMPAELREQDLEEILFELIPRKVSCDPDETAPALIAVYRAFFRWTCREHGSRRAEKCLALLGDDAVDRLHQALADPRRWGMGKRFYMRGKELGYDLSTPAGLNEWLLAANRGVGREGPAAEPAWDPSPAGWALFDDRETELHGSELIAAEAGGLGLGPEPDRDRRRADKRKRKQAKAARRRNRR